MCYEKCDLTAIIQESINDKSMLDCETINYQTGKIFSLLTQINQIVKQKIHFHFLFQINFNQNYY